MYQFFKMRTEFMHEFIDKIYKILCRHSNFLIYHFFISDFIGCVLLGTELVELD